MTFHDVLQRDGLVFTATDAFQRAFSQIHVLEILQVYEDSFTDIVSFGAPGAPGQLLKSFFNGLRQSNSQHKCLAIQHTVKVDQDEGEPGEGRRGLVGSLHTSAYL